MKQLLTILIFILQSIISKGEDFKDLRKSLSCKNIDSVIAVVKEKKYNLEFQNDLIPNWQSTLIICDSCNQEANMINCYPHYLRIISFHQEVVYYSFGRNKIFNGASNEIFQNTLLFDRLAMEFHEVFGSSIDLSELFDNSIIFGSFCGLNDRLLPFRKDMNRFVSRKRIKPLTRWLVSSNFELQMFAIVGFNQLHVKKEIEIPPNTMKIIRYILSRNGKLKYCSGCFVWYEEISNFYEDYKFE